MEQMIEPDCQAGEVALSDTGFVLGKQGQSLEVAWSDVVEIVAYKWDVWGYDIICLGFRREGADGYLEVGQDFTGYDELLACVEGRFRLLQGWWDRVAFPAFATNWTTIWGAKGGV